MPGRPFVAYGTSLNLFQTPIGLKMKLNVKFFYSYGSLSLGKGQFKDLCDANLARISNVAYGTGIV